MKDPGAEKQNNGYFSNTFRARSISLSPWGAGPEPTDHEFMRRLFSSWDVDQQGFLNLQNVVSGFARIKGPRDIMSNISYFFEIYDDDKDGKVDREGILRISEALLFLSRRGLSGGLSSSTSTTSLAQAAEFGPDGAPQRRETKDEQFLSSISAFIRRCFEYADPDQGPAQSEAEDTTSAAADALNSFSIGEDEDDDEDLLDLGDDKSSTPKPESQAPQTPLAATPSSERGLSFGQTTPGKHAEANAALDPNHPLHITLPTFRMLVLADEVLESFFDSGFPNSFHLADAPLPSSTVSSSHTHLTTFASAGIPARPHVHMPALSPGGPGAGVVAPGKGLRGMLDNIVTDGMRVAAEVRRRMDEAQKELDRGAVTRGTSATDDEEEDEELDDGNGRDLLEGADAGAVEPNSKPASVLDQPLAQEPVVRDKGKGKAVDGIGEQEEVVQKDTMFER